MMRTPRLQLRTFVIHLAITLSVIFSGMPSCGTLSKRVELRSEPAGAEVLTTEGEKVGTTPLVLENEILTKLSKNGRLRAVLASPGFQDRELSFEIRGSDQYDVRLTQLDTGYFSKRLLNDFPSQANAMTRELMRIQGLVFAKRLDEAGKLLAAFQSQYPNIAASYVLLASVESQRGKRDQARRYLLRAQSLDPSDPVAARILNSPPATAPAAKGGTR